MALMQSAKKRWLVESVVLVVLTLSRVALLETKVQGRRLGVSHVFDPHSPMRPPNCDEACVTGHRLDRLAAHLNKTSSKYDAAALGRVTTRSYRRNTLAEYYVAVSGGLLRGHTTGAYQPIYMDIDTGSDFAWIQCKPCSTCYPQELPVFDPSKSTTFAYNVHGDPFCDLVQSSDIGNGSDATRCNYLIEYVDGASSFGYVSQDQFTFTDHNPGGSTITFDTLGFGCGVLNQLGSSTVTSGVLGLASGNDLSWPEQLRDLYHEISAFSLCFAAIGSAPFSGFLQLGDGSLPTDGYDRTPLLIAKQDLYYVDVVDFVVDGRNVGIPAGVFAINPDGTGGAIVDSGTTFSEVITPAYTPFRDAWRAAVLKLLGPPQNPGPHGLDTCWAYPKDVSLPSVSIKFRDGSMYTLSPDAVSLVYKSNSGKRRMCWPFVENPDGEPANLVIGSISLQRNLVIFDTDNDEFGWQHNKC